MQARFAAALLSLALAAAACSGASSSPAPSGVPGASGASACAKAPAMTTQPQGWGVPSTQPAVIPVLINPAGELTCGANRLLFSFLDTRNAPIGSPDRRASVALYNLARDPAKPVLSVDGTFVWAITGSVGVYVATAAFPEAGTWGAEFSTTLAGKTETVRLSFDVSASTGVVRAGQKAPASRTLTGDPVKISTDSRPDVRLYKTSIDQAIARKEPFLVAFATPKFCTSGQCGPTLERVKPYIDTYPTVTFINVEPYELKADSGGQLQPVLTGGQLTPTKSTTEWGLLSEPWIFVVNKDGIVTASLALIFGEAELTSALDAVK